MTSNNGKGIGRVRAVLDCNFASVKDDPKKAIVSNGWDQLWKEGATPWENSRMSGCIQLALEKLNVPRVGHVLVPGCGKGEDALFFAKEGYDTLGIDLSSTAIEQGRQLLQSQSLDLPNIRLEEGNFFELRPPKEGYDIIYDFTFFCAFPPSVRPMFGGAVNRLINPNGGLLIATVWTIDGARPTGPPYSISLDQYSQALGLGWDLVLNEDSPDPHDARTRVAVWRKGISTFSSKL